MNSRWTRWTPHSLSGPGSALWTATVTWRRLSMHYITCLRIKMIRLVYKIPKPTMDFIHIQNCFTVIKKNNKTSAFFKSIHQNISSIWSFDVFWPLWCVVSALFSLHFFLFLSPKAHLPCSWSLATFFYSKWTPHPRLSVAPPPPLWPQITEAAITGIAPDFYSTSFHMTHFSCF